MVETKPELSNKYSAMSCEELMMECIRLERKLRYAQQDRRRLLISLIVVTAVAVAALIFRAIS